MIPLPFVGDILAIPFFFALAVYFIQKGVTRLTPFELVLFLFSVTGLVADLYFVSSKSQYCG